jgi:hypothetical protein
VLSQLTETVGVSVTDTAAGSYTSTTGSVSSLATSWSASQGTARSTGHGRAGQGGVLPSPGTSSRNVQTSDSHSTGESESISTGISSSTAWGITTSKATGDSESLAFALQRSREFLIEQHELQQLPASAMIISYAGPEGRRVILADANPGIGGSPDPPEPPAGRRHRRAGARARAGLRPISGRRHRAWTGANRAAEAQGQAGPASSHRGGQAASSGGPGQRSIPDHDRIASCR